METNPNNLLTQLKDPRNEEQCLLTVLGTPLSFLEGTGLTLINMSEIPFQIFAYTLEI